MGEEGKPGGKGYSYLSAGVGRPIFGPLGLETVVMEEWERSRACMIVTESGEREESVITVLRTP